LNTPESRERCALWLLWITPALWSVNYIVARTAPGLAEPHILALGRLALAGLIVGFVARSELWRERRSTLAHAWHYLVLGALGMLVCGAWVYQGAKTTSAMNIALIYSASPVLIALAMVSWAGFALLQKKWPSPLSATGRLAAICAGENGSKPVHRLGTGKPLSWW